MMLSDNLLSAPSADDWLSGTDCDSDSEMYVFEEDDDDVQHLQLATKSPSQPRPHLGRDCSRVEDYFTLRKLKTEKRKRSSRRRNRSSKEKTESKPFIEGEARSPSTRKRASLGSHLRTDDCDKNHRTGSVGENSAPARMGRRGLRLQNSAPSRLSAHRGEERIVPNPLLSQSSWKF